MNRAAPFSERQTEYLMRCFKSWLNVAEGGKRGGKNVLQTMAFCILLENHRNRIHLVAGVSIATAKLNILDCDGHGLLNYFEGRCREGKYKNRDCVYVQTKTGEKIVLVSGGGKDGDEKLIKGNTYGMAYVTEANECHPKFLREVFDRTLSSSDRKIFHDLNPKDEGDWYYKDILDYHVIQQTIDAGYGYNYGHFTLVDNMSLSDDDIRRILITYQKGTVWYERDIKGRRRSAEGLVFRYFADNNRPYLFKESDLWEKDSFGNCRLKQKFSKIVIGIDFGGNGSKTTMVATGYLNGYKNFRVLAEEGLPLSGDIDADAICDKFITFYKRIQNRYGPVDWIFPDSASTTMINSLRSAAKRAGLRYTNIKGCRKNEVRDRPRSIDKLLTTGRLLINEECCSLRKALDTLVWDEKKPDIPEDKNINNCNDWWDAFCYCLLDFIEYIDLERG